MKKVDHEKRGKIKAGPTKAGFFCDITSALKTPCCTILESVTDGVFTIDLDKRITWFNRAAEDITGFRSDEAVGHYCFDVFRANICEKTCALEATLTSGLPQVNVRASIITKSGAHLPITVSTSVLRNDDGEVIGGVETFRDLSDMERLRRQLTGSRLPEDIVGRHPKMQEILSSLPDIAESESPVLIEGPTGSGKELIARAIHQLSPRKEEPFIAVNCAALPETLLESELFGYTKGAFTGALRDKPGRFLLADKGTLFLDEIPSTSPAFQADLLRVLDDGEFTPLGGTTAVKADVRLISATNCELRNLVQEGGFRTDLYYRLNVVKIRLPSLRERTQDIPLLVEHFVHKFNVLKDRSVRGVTPEVLAVLLRHPFPGNIRELENIVEYAFVLCKGPLITLEHLPEDLLRGQQCAGKRSLSQSELEEADTIRGVLAAHRTNRDETARLLGISRATLWRKMKKYGLLPP